jgi:hypothetical protein
MDTGEMIGLFTRLVNEEKALLVQKNHDYAGKGDPLGNFKRRAQILALYPDLDLSKPAAVAVVDILKQLDSVLYGLSTGNDLKVEGYESRLRDISIYAKLLTIIVQEA